VLTAPGPSRCRLGAMRWLLLISALNGFLAVAFGAFGAHGLKRRLASLADGAQRLEWWQTAAQYHLAHALAIGLAAVLLGRGAVPGVQPAGIAFLCGIVLFCGSLYTMTLTGVRALGAVTPLGGVAFLVGWACLAWAAWKS
jgi:uncharacterized membrane protein YgdD (TMEM256/DUF423 family)